MCSLFPKQSFWRLIYSTVWCLEYIMVPADVEATFADNSSDYPVKQRNIKKRGGGWVGAAINCMVKQVKSIHKDILLTFNTFKVEDQNLIERNVMKWMFSHWPCYRSSASRSGLRTAVLALGFASGQYGNPQANLKNIRFFFFFFFLSENFHFLVVIFSVYLNKFVFVMSSF